MGQDLAATSLFKRLRAKRSELAHTILYDRGFMRRLGVANAEMNSYITTAIAKAHAKRHWDAVVLAYPAPRIQCLLKSALYYQNSAETLCDLGHHEASEVYMEQAQVFKGMAKCLELGVTM